MTKKRSTLEAVRGVKSHLGDLLSQVRQGQQWKKKYDSLKLELDKLKSEKKKRGVVKFKHVFQDESDDKISKSLNEQFILFDASPQVCKKAKVMAHELKNCFQLMSKRPSTISTCIMYICMKPYMDKNIISEKTKLSLPSINLTTKIIQNFLGETRPAVYLPT